MKGGEIVQTIKAAEQNCVMRMASTGFRIMGESSFLALVRFGPKLPPLQSRTHQRHTLASLAVGSRHGLAQRHRTLRILARADRDAELRPGRIPASRRLTASHAT
jgi:hypothetical protein